MYSPIFLCFNFGLFVTAVAQQSAWGQPDGSGWKRQASRMSDYYCSEQNEYYSQCIPDSMSTTGEITAAPVTTLKALPTAKIFSFSTPTINSSSPPSSSGSFVKISGRSFDIDGHTGYFAGTNSYWIGFLMNNTDVDLVMSHLQISGLKVLRVWGFNIATSTPSSSTVWYQRLVPGSSPAINTGATGLERLDYVVKSAEAHNIKLIINFNNNWADYGGVPAYMTYYNVTQKQWYTDRSSQATYQAYIKAVVSRYTDSTAIFAWELMNEPRCRECPTSVLTSWAKTTSAYIKSLDSNHLVALGDEGFNPSAGDGTYPYQTGEGVAFADNLAISTIDFGTYHMYPDSWGVNRTTWSKEWIHQHSITCLAANKPCILEEYGAANNVTIESAWQQTALTTNGTSGDMFWQYGDTLSTGPTSDDGNTIYYGSSLWKSLVTDHITAIASSGS